MKAIVGLIAGSGSIRMMRREAVVFILAVLLAVAAAARGGEPMPKIEVKEYHHDLGTVTQGARPSYVFKVSNAGTATLVIERVQPG